MEKRPTNNRRTFLSTLAMGVTASGLSVFANTAMAAEALKIEAAALNESDQWFKKIKGSHRVVYDGSTPHDGLPVAWTYVFYMTNNMTETPDEDMTAVCVLRHSAIPFALSDDMWNKYKFGEFFEVNDNLAGAPALRNVVYEPEDGDFPVAGIQGIKQLQERGAMFCVCDLALKVYSGFVAQGLGMDSEKVYEDWKSSVLPGVEIMPSGVWALERAQKAGCAYIFAGN
ncbi:Tat (twin-arginine translocation) pathway signal sequence containing protein [Robertkochia sediminum]|uniref:Tat (twin-arginine translocation) pathway signal sequence containing protein n=1 Tax=Robertkochia sediminum TaxID=2785326 RepID=UPI001932AABA|nr:Tat (twin-arginine translocation) pathway signal sequence containing protein [Robertkochia sediminum]MBL7473801.1 Tat (twin-arginine translocation) pathway signal sequence containing protein [Robertkochia sediminum]